MDARPCDEFAAGFGWITAEFTERASHVLIADGGVWLVDPVATNGLEGRVHAAGRPAGVIQLLDRHDRDCAALAEALEVPHYVVPSEEIPGAPFEFRPVVNMPGWREAVLWWPEARVIVWGDAVGTARYFRARGEPLAVHPFLRLLPPRVSRGLTPQHVLCGHGEGIHGEDAAMQLEQALATARRRIPRWLLNQVRGTR